MKEWVGIAEHRWGGTWFVVANWAMGSRQDSANRGGKSDGSSWLRGLVAGQGQAHDSQSQGGVEARMGRMESLAPRH